MKLVYKIEMHVDPGSKFDPIQLMYCMAEAVEHWREEDTLTDVDDTETTIGEIIFSMPS